MRNLVAHFMSELPNRFLKMIHFEQSKVGGTGRGTILINTLEELLKPAYDLWRRVVYNDRSHFQQ